MIKAILPCIIDFVSYVHLILHLNYDTHTLTTLLSFILGESCVWTKSNTK